jgi:hypothetical protein
MRSGIDYQLRQNSELESDCLGCEKLTKGKKFQSEIISGQNKLIVVLTYTYSISLYLLSNSVFDV